MRSLHLTLLVFCQLLLASFILYSRLASALPIEEPQSIRPLERQPEHSLTKQVVPVPVLESEPAKLEAVKLQSSPTAEEQLVHQVKPISKPQDVVVASPVVVTSVVSPIVATINSAPELKAVEKPFQQLTPKSCKPEDVEKKQLLEEAPLASKSMATISSHEEPKKEAAGSKAVVEKMSAVKQSAEKSALVGPSACIDCIKPFEGQVSFYHMDTGSPMSQLSAPMHTDSTPKKPASEMIEARTAMKVVSPDAKVLMVGKVDVAAASSELPAVAPVAAAVPAPVVNGGLGPLHLLANTLCSYQPERLVADESLNQLYSQRAALRKSLFEFMSLKFTNVERFSSRLNPQGALEIMPPHKSAREAGKRSSHIPSHGWPVVGKCTAHDLKLMAEAAFCEAPANRQSSARALEEDESSSAAVISKILHVSDPREAPAVEKSIEKLNLTQQQLSELQAQATSTRLCRKRSLHLTKALFNHLAEDQSLQSESWPKLYSALSEDDCARRRMIDIMNALSSYRSDSTHIRRDNVEFAFAMDDLRSKVLENEVNVPLTFDKQFIEVEQFLQQSVKLMLSNIDPEKAKLTSIRYRGLIPSGTSGGTASTGPVAASPSATATADDQCLELPQRLLAKNYPTDCNPTQFGQLPDVLRMTATSLELWSIENELAKHSAKLAQLDYQQSPSNPIQQLVSPSKRDVNECITNLVSS